MTPLQQVPSEVGAIDSEIFHRVELNRLLIFG